MREFAGLDWGLFKTRDQIRTAILACGMAGDPEYLPKLFSCMEEKPTARLSGAAFRMITGVDLKRQYLDQAEPKEKDRSSDGEEEDDADSDLPWPDINKVKKRWSEVKDPFEYGAKYLLGRRLGEDRLDDVLLYGFQSGREGAALEMFCWRQDGVLFNWRAPAPRQYRALYKQ